MFPRQLIMWLLWLGVIILVLWAIVHQARAASDLPPLPPDIKVNHTSATVERGAGAKLLISKTFAIPPKTYTNVFMCGPLASNYWWVVETATNANGPWSTLRSNFNGRLVVTNSRSSGIWIYRAKGIIMP